MKKLASAKRVPAAVAAPSEVALPSWATKKPADGLLPVPGKLRDAIAKALGPLDRRYSVTYAARMNAVLAPPSTWGLHRMLSVGDGAGPEVARVLEVLAQHDLPLIAADFWYPSSTQSEGTVEAAAAIFEAALRPPSVATLRRLTVLLSRVRLEAPIARALAGAVARMPSLEVLGLNASGGPGALTVVAASPPLRALELNDLGASELRSLALLPAVEGLGSLTLRRVDADDAAIAALLEAPWAKRLCSLALSRMALVGSDYRAVAGLDALTSLSLRFPDDATVAAIANAEFTPRLERLELHDCRIDARLAKRLAARGLPRLERLIVKHAQMSDAALRIVVDAAPRLKELGIPKTSLPGAWSKRGRTLL
jgi:hypothetical protein